MSANNLPTLLLVDDEPDLLLSLEGLLRRSFRLFTADNGAAALEIVRAESIHIIMSDQRMPGMTGDQLLSQVAQDSPYTVRILLTGYADIQDVIRALNTGGLFRYLTKPWDLTELTDILQEAAEAYEAARLRRDRDNQTNKFTSEVISFLRDHQSTPAAVRLLQQAEALQQPLTVPL